MRPGDPGWIARARVPMPAGGDYIRRPEWQTDVEVVAKKKKVVNICIFYYIFTTICGTLRNVIFNKISILQCRKV